MSVLLSFLSISPQAEKLFYPYKPRCGSYHSTCRGRKTKNSLLYLQTPISPEFTKKILGDEQPITCRFADTLAPEMDKLKAEAAKWATQEEDVLTYAMFPQVAPKFFDKRNAKKQGVDGDHVDYTNQSHPV